MFVFVMCFCVARAFADESALFLLTLIPLTTARDNMWFCVFVFAVCLPFDYGLFVLA